MLDWFRTMSLVGAIYYTANYKDGLWNDLIGFGFMLVYLISNDIYIEKKIKKELKFNPPKEPKQ